MLKVLVQAEPAEPARPMHPVYSGCDTTKSCFGVPSECDVSGDCDFIATWAPAGNFTTVELFRHIPATCSVHLQARCIGASLLDMIPAKWTILLSCPASLLGGSRWVGLGLSRDAVMGEDWVVWCGTGPRDSRPVLGTAWNSGRSSLVTQQTGQVRLVAASLQEDGLFCKLQLDNWIEGRPPQVQNKYNAMVLRSRCAPGRVRPLHAAAGQGRVSRVGGRRTPRRVRARLPRPQLPTGQSGNLSETSAIK